MFIFMLISYKNNNITSDKDWQNLPKGGGWLIKNIPKRLKTCQRHPPPKKNPHVVRVWDYNMPTDLLEWNISAV